MNVQIRGTRKHDGHRYHISTWQTPNWFEWLFMFKRPKVLDYVGKGTKWFVMTLGKKTVFEFTPVKNKELIIILNDEVIKILK